MKSENKSDVEISNKLVGRTAEAVGMKWIRLTQYVNLCSLFIVEDNINDTFGWEIDMLLPFKEGRPFPHKN